MKITKKSAFDLMVGDIVSDIDPTQNFMSPVTFEVIMIDGEDDLLLLKPIDKCYYQVDENGNIMFGLSKSSSWYVIELELN